MKVLVAEDESTPALFLRRTLERLGHEVVVASNGLEAWERMQDTPFRLVITDWMMPGLDGLGSAEKIRGRVDSSYTYIILLTSREGLQDRLAGLAWLRGPMTFCPNRRIRPSWRPGWQSPAGSWRCRKSWNGRTSNWPSWRRPTEPPA